LFGVFYARIVGGDGVEVYAAEWARARYIEQPGVNAGRVKGMVAWEYADVLAALKVLGADGAGEAVVAIGNGVCCLTLGYWSGDV